MSETRPPDVERARAWLTAHESELIEDLRSLLRIPSVEGEPEPNAPFGIENRKALDYVLRLATDWGMATKDVEGYAGHAEFGSGKPMIMALGHLDVVPAGEGWEHDPFGAEIDGEYMYSRGTTDDKGPTMAAFYAARALKETCPNLPARVRVVFGCNEESGFRCVKRYFETEEAPVYGVAPDSGWPLYHAEKGIANMVVSVPAPRGGITVVSFESGSRPNIVPDRATATVELLPELVQTAKHKLEKYWDKNVDWSLDGNQLSLSATGKSAHGSTPYLGDNAAARVVRVLQALADADQQRELLDLLLLFHPSGAGIGIHGEDAVSRDLTSNAGIVSLIEGNIAITLNIRYPVTWKGEDVRNRATEYICKFLPSAEIMSFEDSPPLYFPLDEEPVTSLLKAYEVEVGDGRVPGVMGGGTYARAVPNSVSIGTGWDGDGPAHEPDERIKVSHILKMAHIYVHMLYKLAYAAANR